MEHCAVSATSDNRITVACQDCGAECKSRPAKDGTPKTPMRWRKTDDGFRCPQCQAAQYVPRSIRLRIVAPHESESRDRAEMYRALNAASKESNQFANWYLQRLLAADAVIVDAIKGLEKNKNGSVKLPPVPQVEWYRDATRLFPQVAPSSLVQQARMVASYYGKERFAALIAMSKNVRSYRWDGLPVVVNAQAWKLVRIDDSAIVLRAQIGPGKSWTIKVFAQGEDLHRMRQLADGEATAGTAVFVRRAREPRPGETKRVRVWYLRVSAQVPRAKRTRGPSLKEKTLQLGYDAENLLYGVPDEGDDWVFEYPAVALRSLIVAHRKLDRQRQIDASYQRQGWSRRKWQRWSKGRSASCEKNNAKVKAQIDLCVATLVRACQSQQITAVDFDVTPRGWIESFPYYLLQARVKTSLENAGISLHMFGVASTGDEIECDSEPEQTAFAGPKCETEATA